MRVGELFSVHFDAAGTGWCAGSKAIQRAGLGNLVRRIEHVGSTAVPGLPAKSVIDLDVVVTSDADLASAAGSLRHDRERQLLPWSV